MHNLSACAQLVGVLGLLAACSSSSGTPSQTSPSTVGGDGQTNGSGEGGNEATQGTNAGGSKNTSTSKKSAGGSSSSTKKTSNSSAAASSGGSEDASGGDGGADTASESGGSTEKTSSSSGGKTGVGSSSSSSRGGRGGTGGTKAGGAGGTKADGGTSSSSSSVDDELRKSQCSGKPGPSYDDFFSESKVGTLRVTIDSSALGGKTPVDALWDKKSHCPPHQASQFIPASFTYESPDKVGNVTCEKVGIRFRGSRNRQDSAMYTQIQGFKLDMQALDTGASVNRRFADLNRINLLSIELDDKSHMLQCLSYKAMRNFDIPAPRCNHLKVYINGSFYGLLENVEQPNRGYVRRHFGTNEGFLFVASPSMSDCSGSYKFEDSLARFVYGGDSFSSYTTQYMLDSATATDAEKTLIPMMKCGDATQTPDDAKFKTCIQEWLDVDEWLRMIAVESAIPELQSWIGFYRNAYLYFKPDSSAPHGGRFSVWSWDLDTGFHKITCSPNSCDPFTSIDSLYNPMSGRAPLVKRLTKVFKSEYCTLLKSFLSTVYKPSLVDDMAKAIEGGVSGDPHTTPTAWQSEVSTIRSHITSQTAKMQTAINSACQ